jgi:hypothetical protein
MWPFNRKPHNRRFRQRNVLEVKLSMAQLRRHRVRVLFYASSASLAVFFGLYLCWRGGECLLNRLVYRNEAFAIRVLDIQTDGVIAPEQIRRWAGVRESQNLFTLDLVRLKRDLELVPAIQSVAVERVLPQTLRIHVQEREPVASILSAALPVGTNAQTGLMLLDADGYVMMPLAPRQRATPVMAEERYPLITGATLAALTPGRAVESGPIRAALRLIAAFDHSPMAGLVELKQIDVSSPLVLQVTTDQQSEVTLRTGDLERQLNRWRILHDRGLPQGRQIGTLDLSVVDNIPLRWMEAGALPSAAPKTKKTSPYRKKHV